jgi:preprotein translocase subunit SecF
MTAGWIAGGADLFGVLYLWDRYKEDYGVAAIITFGFTLLALVAATVLFARASPGPEAERAV